MTLSEMASYVCTKVNQTEAEDVAACKGFLTQRHKLVWQDQLWKDSLVEYAAVLSPDDYEVTNNWLPDLGILLLPPLIQRVIAVRNESRKLSVQRQELFYRRDYDSFSKSGAASDFVLLSPCVWQIQESATLYLARYTADAGTHLTCDLLDSDSVGITRATTDEALEFVTLGETSRIDSVTKAASSSPFYLLHEDAAVIVSGGGLAAANGTFALNGSFNNFAFFGDLQGQSIPIAGSFNPSVRLNAGGEWQVIATNLGTYSTRYQTTTNPPPPLPHLDSSWFVAGGTAPAPSFSMSGIILTMAASDTNAHRRQRIRFVEIPTQEMTVRVLGKRSVPTFTADNDEPAINGADNLLLALAEHDMWRRARQFGFAAELLPEVNSLFEQLKHQEVVQQAHNVRLVPDDGYGGLLDFQGTSALEF